MPAARAKKFFSRKGADVPISDRFAQNCANARDLGASRDGCETHSHALVRTVEADRECVARDVDRTVDALGRRAIDTVSAAPRSSHTDAARHANRNPECGRDCALPDASRRRRRAAVRTIPARAIAQPPHGAEPQKQNGPD